FMPSGTMHGDLMLSAYIPKVIKARPNGFFKNKAFNTKGLEVKKIPGGTASVLQPPDVSVNKPFKNKIRRKWDEWISNGEKEFTKHENHKKALYELVCKWVSEVWKEISSEILIKSFEASGLTLNPNGKISVDKFDEVSDNEFNKKISDDKFDEKVNDELNKKTDNEFSNEEITHNEFDE
ncbi:10237_t:CDS:2, partial [Dentiscutata erythropus]